MSTRWSSTRAAINTGYGSIPFNFNPPNIEEDIPDFSQLSVRHSMVNHKMDRKRVLGSGCRGGGKLVKGSKEARQRMAYLRSLRKTKGGSYTDAALRGGKHYKMRGGSYTDAALRGGADITTEVAGVLGATGMEVVKELSKALGESVKDLLKDPKGLVQYLKNIVPDIAKKLWNWLRGKKTMTKEEEEKQKRKQKLKKYLEYLRVTDPERYKQTIERLRQEKLQRKEQELFGYTDDNPPPLPPRPSKNPAPSSNPTTGQNFGWM